MTPAMTKRLPVIEAGRSSTGAPTVTVQDGGKASTFEVSTVQMLRERDRLNRDPSANHQNGSDQ